MIKHSKLPKNIQNLLPLVEEYLKSRRDVHIAYLFGSLAKRRPSPLSDVDIAVYLSEDADIPERKMDILGRLTELSETDEIDLVILNSAPLTLKMKILENRKILADNSPFLRHQYESLTMREYFDFSITEMSILERRFLHG